MSQFVYGSSTLLDAEVNFSSINRVLVRGKNGRAYREQETWGLRGRIPLGQVTGGYQAILDAMQERRNIFSQNGQSCGFPNTPFFFDANASLGGPVVISPPCHDSIEGAGWATSLNYKLTIQNEKLFSDSYPNASDGALIDFHESVSFVDNFGLPMTAERIPQNAPPIIQVVSQGSWYFATQKGSATSSLAWPSPASPLFPGLLRTSGGSARNVEYESPEMVRGNPVSYKTSWQWQFVSAIPFFQFPTIAG